MPTEKLNPDAWAFAEDDELDARPDVQEVDEDMIFAYVMKEEELPECSARPFAAWLNSIWTELHSGEQIVTNRDIIHGAIVEWCGGRTR